MNNSNIANDQRTENINNDNAIFQHDNREDSAQSSQQHVPHNRITVISSYMQSATSHASGREYAVPTSSARHDNTVQSHNEDSKILHEGHRVILQGSERSNDDNIFQDSIDVEQYHDHETDANDTRILRELPPHWAVFNHREN